MGSVPKKSTPHFQSWKSLAVDYRVVPVVYLPVSNAITLTRVFQSKELVSSVDN